MWSLLFGIAIMGAGIAFGTWALCAMVAAMLDLIDEIEVDSVR